MAKTAKTEWNEKKMGEHKMWLGLGLFIFGLVLWYTNSWATALMVIGILVFLKGLYVMTMK